MHAPLSNTRQPLPAAPLPLSTASAAANRDVGFGKDSSPRRIGSMGCLLAAIVLSLTVTDAAFAAEPINTLERSGLFGYEPSGVAIRGYDTVAYFTDGKPVEGSEDFESQWQGATWRFASQQHLDLFETDPTAYAPQYGGYCAYGVAEDGLVKIEPDNWSIVDDKLYLNYDDGVQETWQQDIPGYIAEADAKFENLLAAE